jgi:hypothetical protein
MMMNILDPCDIDLEQTSLIEASAGTGKTYTICLTTLRKGRNTPVCLPFRALSDRRLDSQKQGTYLILVP